MADPLRYRISSWRQLPGCLSNTSRHLKIRVADIFKEPSLVGLRITVEHCMFGTLFATVIDASGQLIYPEYAYRLSDDDILKQLENFGFLVTYTPEKQLPLEQLEYLKTVQALGFDKLRILPVRFNDGKVEIKVVVFNVEHNPNWLQYPYEASYKEWTQALANTGSAMNITDVSLTKQFDWGWLDYVANIQDIIDNQTFEV